MEDLNAQLIAALSKQPNGDLLRLTLMAAVPLWIAEFRKLTEDERIAIAKTCSQVIAEKGDVLQFGGGKKGEAANAFNALAKGLAVMAFVPGGVTAFGLHFEA